MIILAILYNITTMNRYTSVGNLNRMISLNGQNIEYDEIGNPTKYKNLDLIWNGRTLKSYGNVKFNYDKYGNRIQKHVGNNTTNYYYDNSNIIHLKDSKHANLLM